MTDGHHFQTSACRAYGHPEFTIALREPPMLPSHERMLLNYFEASVSRGVRFAPGEKVTFGWAHLRLTGRPDGTIGVQAYDLREEGQWSEWVDAPLRETWLQQQVLASLGVRDSSRCPRQSQAAIVCRRLGEGLREIQLKRFEPNSSADSGWFVGCFDEDHDHDARENLAPTTLAAIAARLPVTAQFFVLPWDCAVLLDYNGRSRVRATVLLDDEERVPVPGSYLDRLNSRDGL